VNQLANYDKFNILYADNAQDLLGYAIRRSSSTSEAADVVAETMLVAWRRIDDVPIGPESRLWLFGVARNVMSNTRRTNRRHRQLINKISFRIESVIIDDNDIIFGSRSDLVQQALQVLKPIEAEIISLNVWEELTPLQISNLLEIPNETVRTHLHRARTKLRDTIGQVEVAG
jgi:RNA polymerase sigma-70 factor (ECF subfamily)